MDLAVEGAAGGRREEVAEGRSGHPGVAAGAHRCLRAEAGAPASVRFLLLCVGVEGWVEGWVEGGGVSEDEAALWQVWSVNRPRIAMQRRRLPPGCVIVPRAASAAL